MVFLAYASAVNMKVRGALGNEDSIVIESSTSAAAKSAPAVPFGLLALLDRHAHLNVLVCLQPNWVQWKGGGEGGGGGGRRGRMATHWPFSRKTQKHPPPLSGLS
jgi:hypothetical protein